MTKAKIIEIFQSIQGEGKYAGVKQVFVRFLKCNISCEWCDTSASMNESCREFTAEEVLEQILQLWQGSHSVSLTGGEPLMYKDFLKELLPLLGNANMPVYLETNGILYEELKDVVNDVDIIAMDFKLPSSTGCKPYWQEHKEFLKIARQKDLFVKAVVSSKTDKQDIVDAVDLLVDIDPQILLVLQPNTYDMHRSYLKAPILDENERASELTRPQDKNARSRSIATSRTSLSENAVSSLRSRSQLNRGFEMASDGVMRKCLEYHDYCLQRLPKTRVMPQIHKFMNVR